jgi:chemotaxis protein methyltransferase CheR
MGAPVLMPARLSDADCARFQSVVRDASGIEIPVTRRADLERAVAQALAEGMFQDAAELLKLLEDRTALRRQPLLENLVTALTVGETHFFRNRPQFDALAETILPDLVARRRDVRRLRLWSAGCASGEEAYSLAILLDWRLPELRAWDVTLLATDINRHALEKAQRGLYGPWSFREVPAEIQHAYFLPRDRDLEVHPRLRERVTFGYLNLVSDAYPSLLTNTSGLDLILFRNVLIYFGEATARAVVGRMHAALAEGGWLVVGHADQSPTLFQPFAVRSFPGALAYHKSPVGSLPAAAPSQPRLRTPKVGSATQSGPPLPPGAPPIRSAPTPAPDDCQRGLDLWQQGRPDEALRLLQSAAAANPANARAPYLAARIEANRLQLESAAHWLQMTLQRDALFAPAHYLHGLVLQEQGQLGAALDALRRCVFADPRFALGHYALACLFARQGQGARAARALANVAQLLAGLPRAELLSESDGLTVGQLLELVAAQKALV